MRSNSKQIRARIDKQIFIQIDKIKDADFLKFPGCGGEGRVILDRGGCISQRDEKTFHSIIFRRF